MSEKRYHSVSEFQSGCVQRSDDANLPPSNGIFRKRKHVSFYGSFHTIYDPSVCQSFHTFWCRTRQYEVERVLVVAYGKNLRRSLAIILKVPRLPQKLFLLFDQTSPRPSRLMPTATQISGLFSPLYHMLLLT